MEHVRCHYEDHYVSIPYFMYNCIGTQNTERIDNDTYRRVSTKRQYTYILLWGGMGNSLHLCIYIYIYISFHTISQLFYVIHVINDQYCNTWKICRSIVHAHVGGIRKIERKTPKITNPGPVVTQCFLR